MEESLKASSCNNNNNNNKNIKKRKRCSSSDCEEDVLREAYRAVQRIEPRASSGRPGTPHSFFASSWNVVFHQDDEEEEEQQRGGGDTSETTTTTTTTSNSVVEAELSISKTKLEQSNNKQQQTCTVVHRHANELCVIAVNDMEETSNPVRQIQFVFKKPPPDSMMMSAGARRSLHAKLLRGRQQPSRSSTTSNNMTTVISPSTVLAELSLMDGTFRQVRAGVWGTLLELNDDVTPELLREDPLLKGYLAVVATVGPFPPKHYKNSSSGDGGDTPTAAIASTTTVPQKESSNQP